MDDFSFNVPELMTQLFKADRNTTLDFNLDTERSYQIWSSPKKFNETSNKVWIDISIRVNVIEPFVVSTHNKLVTLVKNQLDLRHFHIFA